VVEAPELLLRLIADPKVTGEDALTSIDELKIRNTKANAKNVIFARLRLTLSSFDLFSTLMGIQALLIKTAVK